MKISMKISLQKVLLMVICTVFFIQPVSFAAENISNIREEDKSTTLKDEKLENLFSSDNQITDQSIKQEFLNYLHSIYPTTKDEYYKYLDDYEKDSYDQTIEKALEIEEHINDSSSSEIQFILDELRDKQANIEQKVTDRNEKYNHLIELINQVEKDNPSIAKNREWEAFMEEVRQNKNTYSEDQIDDLIVRVSGEFGQDTWKDLTLDEDEMDPSLITTADIEDISDGKVSGTANQLENDDTSMVSKKSQPKMKITKKLPKTGASKGIMIFIAACVILIAGVLFTRKKK